MTCNWTVFPNSLRPNDVFRSVGSAFDAHMDEIDSSIDRPRRLVSNDVLAVVAPELQKAGFIVETGKGKDQIIHVPVLYGERGQVAKDFYPDAYHEASGTVVEVEAGRAVANYQFLKDLFESCMMDGVQYLCIAVCNTYKSGSTVTKDYEKICTFFQTLYASNRMQLPLKGIMIIGY